MKKICTLILILVALNVHSQVNGYAKVSNISGVNLTISNPNESFGTFTNGSKVIVMQMQDDVIGSNTGNNSSFGNISAISNAGMYELAIINTVTRVSGTVTAIKLNSPLSHGAYHTGANSSVQIITFPTLGSPNYTTTANITAVPWDGNRGGVIAFAVNGILTLNHNITADTAGFRGAVADASSSPYGTCNTVDYLHAVDPLYGNKGEGIYKATNVNYTSGKGKILNGGGGGNTINAGGGGGGNYTAGGDGYQGWSCGTGTGGVGGTGLSTYFAAGDRLFMGGGGGSGEANDNYNDRGGNGGGIIIIQATQLRTTGSGAVSISANGQLAPTVGNDGAGGAGAGGSIALDINTYSIAASKPLTIAANGGNGGDVGDGAQHGSGGGGGEGAVLFSTARPTTNITTTTTPGLGGRIQSGGTRAPSGSGATGAGIIPVAINILPLKLVSFTAVKNNDNVQLNWITENEVNTNRFEIQRSANGTVFETIGTVAASNNSAATKNYSFADPKLISSVTYYRLRMVDADEKYTYSNVLVMRASNSLAVDVTVFPNPAKSNASLYIKSDVSTMAAIRVVNMQGASVYTQQSLVSKGENIVPMNRTDVLSNGVYNVQVTINNTTYFTRLIVQK